MYLIADSGSTKTDWLLLDKSSIQLRVQTKGLNPFFRTSEDIADELRITLLPAVRQAERIYFYGAGIVNDEKAEVVRNAISQVFTGSTIEMYSDIIGAARATCGDDPGIVCILGTGSNACLYDGETIVENIPPMGYILGDEGSGAALGKTLIGDYFKLVMPDRVREKFRKRFDLDKNKVLNRVYREKGANEYLAAFSVFLSEEPGEVYCKQVLYDNLKLFVKRNVLKLEDTRKLPVHFVGSIAFYFQDALEIIMKEEYLLLGRVIKEPIEELAKYYRARFLL